jgi:hypothetical protein
MSSRYDVVRDHIVDFLIFLASAPSLWFSLNTSYDHLAMDKTAVVAALVALAVAVMATATATATATGMATATATATQRC